MTGGKIKNLLFLWFLTLLLAILLTPSLGLAAPPKGEVVYATSATNFFQVGGDSATHVSGYPFLARTIFDSLDYVDQRGDTILPGLAKSW
jgi:ABC-type transport system substrate-binding protein